MAQITLRLGQDSYTVFGKPGIDNWQSLTPSDILLSRFIQPESNQRIVMLGCGNGFLATYIAKHYPTSSIWICDSDWVKLNCVQETITHHLLKNVNVVFNHKLTLGENEVFDIAVLMPGKGRKLARRWLVEAFHHLRPDGLLLISGANDIGIQSVIADGAELFNTPAKILGYKKGHRAASIKKQIISHFPAWAEEPGIAPGTWHTFQTSLDGNTFTFHTLPGVFSYDQVDEGTDLLINSLPINIGNRILDVGCGYGIIGLSLAARPNYWSNTNATMDMVDSNLLALASAQLNLSANHNFYETSAIARIRIFCNDLMLGLAKNSYDTVISNPPFHTGRIVDYTTPHALIQQAAEVLDSEGRLYIVANRFIRYEKWIKNFFRQVEIINETNRFHVVYAQNPIKRE